MPASTLTGDSTRLGAYLSAILAWREHIDVAYGGLSSFDNAASVRTILFACNAWLASDIGDNASRERVSLIKAEIEDWLSGRHEPYLG